MIAPRALLLSAALLAVGCGGTKPPGSAAVDRTKAHAPLDEIRTLPGKPAVALVVREGDPAPVVGMALSLDGLDAALARPLPEASAALAGMIEARLAGALETRVVPSWSGVRVASVAPSDAEAAKVARALLAAVARPVAEGDVVAAQKKVRALRGRPLEDAALVPYAACIGAPHAMPDRARLSDDLGAPELETLRARVHARTRAALAVVGRAGAAAAVLDAVGDAAPFPEARDAPPVPRASAVDVGSYTTPAPGTRIHVALRLARAGDAPLVAAALGDGRSPVVQRLAALRVPMRLREATGTVHGATGCVGLVVEPSAAATPTDIGDAVAIVSAETRALLGEDGAVASERTSYARRTGDAREAATLAAHWALSTDRSPPTSDDLFGTQVVVALGARPRTSPREGDDAGKPDALGPAVEAAIARGVRTTVEVRSRVEHGQGEAWVLFGSPCGVAGETEADAGLTALFVMAAATSAPDGVRLQPWITASGVGLLAHGPPLRGESSRAHARRLGDAVGRAFAAAPLGGADIARGRVERTRRVSPALARLAGVLAPGAPSLVAPLGGSDAAPRASDAAVVARAEALRAGPLRLVVLANEDPAQVAAAEAAVDRWIAPVRDGRRVCPAAGGGAGRPRAGTYATSGTGARMPEAWVAFPLAGDARTRAAAEAFAHVLDGEGGLLERALATSPPLAAQAEARVVGGGSAPALAIRVAADDAALDAAVLQVRALVDRARQGGLTDADLARALARRSRAELDAAFDPRTRAVGLFDHDPPERLAPPSPDDVRAFARAQLGEDGMLVVAQRPTRSDAP